MPIIVSLIVFLVAVIAMVAIFLKLTACVHAWELVDKTELPSGFENMAKAEIAPDIVNAHDIPSLAMRTVILVMRCPKCGAARIYKESA